MMNTNMIRPKKLLMVDEKGNQIELEGTIELNEVDCWSPSEIDSYASVSKTELSFNFTNDVRLTKKKLIKLLISKGIGRNGANEIAKYLLKKNGKYTMFDLMMW